MENLHLKFKITTKKILLHILLVSLFFSFSTFNFQLPSFNFPVFAQYIYYPISELGNCRNQKECYLYCQIPQNTPACWSYGKYVINAQVLGEQDEQSPEEKARRLGIVFPIPQLGNCASPRECMKYCELPENKKACFKFAKEKGLHQEDAEKTPPSHVIQAAISELGCDSKEGCMALCSLPENHQKCLNFARRHGIERRYEARYGRPVEEMVNLAKKELDCNDEESCWRLCNRPEYKDKCREFAKKHALVKDEDIKNYEGYQRIDKAKMLEDAKVSLGCDSNESCMQFCQKRENHSKCSQFGRKHGIGPPEFEPEIESDKPCSSEEECQAYCEKHPDECPGYNDDIRYEDKRYESKRDDEYISSSVGESSANREDKGFGDFLGPSGCKTEEECQAYCQKHPDECPGFPKPEPQNSTNLRLYNRQQDYQGEEYKNYPDFQDKDKEFEDQQFSEERNDYQTGTDDYQKLKDYQHLSE